jgi:hypothetical protein
MTNWRSALMPQATRSEMRLQRAFIKAIVLTPPEGGSASTTMQRFHRSERDCELAAR